MAQFERTVVETIDGVRVPEPVPAPAGLTRSKPEHYAVIGIAVLIVVALLYVVVFAVELPSDKYGILRFLMAVAAGVVGAFLPGATIEIDGKFAGMPIKTAGAASFFALVFLGLPTPDKDATPSSPAPAAVVVPSKLELTPLSVDLRSSKGFAEVGDGYRTAAPALVLPLGFAGYQPGGR